MIASHQEERGHARAPQQRNLIWPGAAWSGAEQERVEARQQAKGGTMRGAQANGR